MERVRRIAQFWNWLPAFRAVAESQHLPTAARELGISAAGLSRTIKLLEHQLGYDLFARRARRLELNEAGRSFLQHVRDAMRRIDDGLHCLAGLTYSGPLRIAASNSVSQVYVLPALHRLAPDYPELVPELVTVNEAQAATALRKGEVDLALLEHYEEADEEVTVDELAKTSYGIYCGQNHELAQRDGVELTDCLACAFVGPAAGGSDGWPAHLPRRVVLRVSALNLALDACEEGKLLALLPDDVATLRSRQLCRLPVGTLAQTTVFMAYRHSLGGRDRVAVMIEALREVATASDRC